MIQTNEVCPFQPQPEPFMSTFGVASGIPVLDPPFGFFDLALTAHCARVMQPQIGHPSPCVSAVAGSLACHYHVSLAPACDIMWPSHGSDDVPALQHLQHASDHIYDDWPCLTGCCQDYHETPTTAWSGIKLAFQQRHGCLMTFPMLTSAPSLSQSMIVYANGHDFSSSELLVASRPCQMSLYWHVFIFFACNKFCHVIQTITSRRCSELAAMILLLLSDGAA